MNSRSGRWLPLMLLVLLFVTLPARAQDAQTGFLLHTADGWQVPGRDCLPGDCAVTAPSLPVVWAALLPDTPIRITLAGAPIPDTVTLSLSSYHGDDTVLATSPVYADLQPGDTLEWQHNLPGEHYRLLLEARQANGETHTQVFAVEMLLPGAAEDFFPQPPPVFLQRADFGWLEGLRGGYCFPPGEQGVCLLYEAPPYPDEFSLVPNGSDLHLLLGALPFPRAVDLYLYATTRDGAVAALQADVTGEALRLDWTPDVPPGDYVLQVRLSWDETTDAEYYFGVSLSTLPQGIQPAQFTLWTSENRIVGGAQGSYCWSDDTGGICADYMFPSPQTFAPLVDGNLVYIVVQSNDLPDEVYASLYTPDVQEVLPPTQMQAPEPGVYTLRLENVPPGEYVLLVGGYWAEGKDTSNFFGVRVDTPGSSE